MTTRTFAAICGVGVSSPLSRPSSGARAKRPNGVVPSTREQADVDAGTLSVASPGWTTAVVWWQVMTVICYLPRALSRRYHSLVC